MKVIYQKYIGMSIGRSSRVGRVKDLVTILGSPVQGHQMQTRLGGRRKHVGQGPIRQADQKDDTKLFEMSLADSKISKSYQKANQARNFRAGIVLRLHHVGVIREHSKGKQRYSRQDCGADCTCAQNVGHEARTLNDGIRLGRNVEDVCVVPDLPDEKDANWKQRQMAPTKVSYN
jgi:hypothetical protein